MSMLVILLPAPRPADEAPAAEQPLLTWLLSPDGLAISRQGQASAAALPKADTVVAVVDAQAVAWHRLVAPKAPANRLRAALAGMLEEQLLADDEHTHLALAPQWAAGQDTWVAALPKPWLQAQLASLAAAGVLPDRLVPALAPRLDATAGADAPSGHFFSLDDSAGDSPDHPHLRLALSDAQGACCLPLAGAWARAALPGWQARGAQFTATPAAAAAAERWLGQSVAVRSAADQALAAVRQPWNLLQFDLLPQTRGRLALGKLGRQMLSPAWAPARWGVAALLALQVLALNVSALRQQDALADSRRAMDALLRSSHPQVRAVLDAPAQMRSETARLRVAAGVPAEDDFEAALAAAAAAWPEGLPPASQLRYEPGRLSLPAGAFTPPQVEQFGQRLKASGWTVAQQDGSLVLQLAKP